jgi:hypothetical protein
MSRRRPIRAVFVLASVILSLAGRSVAHAGVVLGASFGYTHFSYPDVPEIGNDVIGIPSSEEWGQPGVRVGYVAPGGRWDLNADVGLVFRSGTIGGDETSVEVLPQFQVNAGARRGFIPFVNGGVGIAYQTAPIPSNSISATRPVYGAGAGVRESVSDGHGFVRLELRYDHVPKSEEGTLTFFATDMFSIKLGFDLLVAR